MSAATITTAPDAARREIHTTFVGLLRGELRKIIHMRVTWVMLAVITLFIVGAQLVLVTGPKTGSDLRNAPLDAFYQALQGDAALVRIFSGIFMLILTAHVIGLEYQHGTIRVLLARGVGRLQLLGAKVAALALVGLVVMALESLIELAFAWGLTLAAAQGTQPWRALGPEFWADLRIYIFWLALNMVVTMLLAVAASAVGRSLAFGLAVGLSWFAVDNLLTIVLALLVRVTQSDFWAKLSGALLGPLLNRLPDYIAPAYHEVTQGPHGAVIVTRTVGGFGPQPLVQPPASNALLVIGIYTVIFIVVAIVPTWRRDVLD
ncbi:MAG TPA: ABC transporter permease [Ktedonobacterales bacterium]|jgi:ABC-type transport system involved in multi-copper enzyme maturation permease subunit|nr:ABC transporter permease [Ktedonobacterales bacterium]